MLLCHLFIFFGEIFVKIFCLSINGFLFLLLSFKSYVQQLSLVGLDFLGGRTLFVLVSSE